MASIGSCGRVRCGKCGSLVGPPLELVASTMRQGSAVPDRTVVVELELSDASKSGLERAARQHGEVCDSEVFEVRV